MWLFFLSSLPHSGGIGQRKPGMPERRRRTDSQKTTRCQSNREHHQYSKVVSDRLKSWRSTANRRHVQASYTRWSSGIHKVSCSAIGRKSVEAQGKWKTLQTCFRNLKHVANSMAH